MAEPRPAGEIYGYTFDDCFYDLLFYLTKHPDYVCAPRGQKIKECLAQTLVLEDPRARLIANPERQANYGFSVGEFLWYWQGREDLEMMQYYNRRSANFSNNGETINSAYGKRMLVDRGRGGLSQWETCVKTLAQDPDSRRAVLLINRPDDQESATLFGSKDVPCTLSLQFFIRDNELHLHVHMRSNDVWWGLTNDLFSFTLFQECMLLELQKEHPDKFGKLELGRYYHTAGSMHIYERHFMSADHALEHYRRAIVIHQVMPPLESLKELKRLCEDEANLRHRMISKIDLEKYSGACHWMAARLNEHRQRRDAEESLKGEQKAD